jgi:hypothetical protein
MPLNLKKAGGPVGASGPDPESAAGGELPDQIKPAMDYLKSKHLKGKIGGTMRRELQAGNFGTAASCLLSEVGWIRKSDLKGSGQLGRELRDIVNQDRDLPAARARLMEAGRTGFRAKQLNGRRGKILRDLLNADRREEAVEAALNFGHINQDKMNGQFIGPIRKMINDDKLKAALADLKTTFERNADYHWSKKDCSGSLGGDVRRALNARNWKRVEQLISSAARSGVSGPGGSLGSMINAAMGRNDETEIRRLVSEAVSHPPQEILKGQVGNLIRHALRDQRPDRAEEILVNLSRRMDPKGLKGALGKQLRRKFNAGDKQGAVQLMFDWLQAKEASHRRKQAAKGGPAPAAGRGKTWFGPPTATWAAKRAIAAVGRGEAPGEAIATIRDNGGKGAIAAAFREWGVDKLREYPGIGMVIVYCDFLADIPGVGDILSSLVEKIDEYVEDGVRKGLGAAEDYFDSVF